jgi:Cof subfamily protein (haloacid dehalogenase superfamily)
MGYKLICIDMDGTLFNRKKQITEATKESLRKAYEMGVQIVISTGRTYVDAEYYSNLIGVKSPVISANGAYIKEKDKNEIIYHSLLGETLALRILQICDESNMAFSLHTSQKEYYGGIFLKILWAIFYLKSRLRGQIMMVGREYITTNAQWLKVIANERDHIVKCVIIDMSQAKLRKIRDKLINIAELEVTSSASNNIEIARKGVSKGQGVEILTHYYNLKKDEVMAIGDSENDLSMIEYAGLGVAMGNATDIVKEKANYITDTNDHDGVAKVIDKFVLSSNIH